MKVRQCGDFQFVSVFVAYINVTMARRPDCAKDKYIKLPVDSSFQNVILQGISEILSLSHSIIIWFQLNKMTIDLTRGMLDNLPIRLSLCYH
jgi:hypothetical protein